MINLRRSSLGTKRLEISLSSYSITIGWEKSPIYNSNQKFHFDFNIYSKTRESKQKGDEK